MYTERQQFIAFISIFIFNINVLIYPLILGNTKLMVLQLYLNIQSNT